ncbi:TRAP transporter permease [Calidifontibacillus erzurumensis]|uniref:TRAP transporter permease n=1 Tax=Calidifontibacillus erzurumensis TaxID=2741433 RepID=A0A8J8GJY4_9BACI|nr:TRAP transporter permease [Calidifontibacillus erzurumensis]NSL53146.1 TRAP transporter permease [Calidifontibacillus erzurumensis]
MQKEKINQESLPEQDLQEILSKYDKEASYRTFTGIMKWIVTIGAISFSLFQLYTAIFGNLASQLQRSIHLTFALGLIFLLYPISNKLRKKKLPIYDVILTIVSIVVGLYWTFQYEELINRAGMYNTLDFIVGGLAILLVLEASRRVVGVPITIIAILFLLYALYGRYMPGFLEHRGVSLERLISHMYYTLDGILGTPLSVSATFIFLFLLFGAFLEKSGVGQYFNDLALLIAGRSVGGPAKVAVFSSALQGMISGSSVANVVTSGSFTIPMMKKSGYRREFAGAVEAAASTGGQLMPPIMGAAAFLMAEFTGIPYWDIAKAAAIPAILYFTGIWIIVHFEAKRTGLRGLTKEELPDKKEVLKKLHLLIPIIVIIALMSMGFTPIRSALLGILSIIVVAAFRKDTRMTIKDIFEALANGARTALGVAAATACAGIIVGVVTLTGLGLKFANGLIDLSGGNLILTLVFTMIASLILGMGSPTTANYIITSTMAAPAIILLLSDPSASEIPATVLLSAHMFAFYFGIIADITPPVALAAFAATGISGGNPIRTGVEASRLAIAAFLIPYIFVFSPSLFLIDTTFVQAAMVIITSIIGMTGLGAGAIGYFRCNMNIFERLLGIVGGLLLIYPGGFTDLIGLGLLAVLLASQIMKSKKQNYSPMNA